MFFEYGDRGTIKLAGIDMAGNMHMLAADVGGTDVTRPYSGGSFSVARNGRFAYMQASPAAPPALATGTAARDIATLTALSANLLGQRTLGAVEEIDFDSSTDGRKIQGWIVKPPHFDAAKKYPLLLEIHGGPFAAYGASFAAEHQLYAAAGYVVLYVNPRGSTGYGEEFANLIHHDYPDNDYGDLMSGVDAVLGRGTSIRSSLFVTGGSGGGVLTAWIVGHTDRFRAAVVVKPVINWTSFVLTADMTNYFYRYWFAGFPWDDEQAYWKRSPLAYVGNVHTPTMLMTGESDYRTPSGEAEQFYEALKLRRVDTALVRVPHALARHFVPPEPADRQGRLRSRLARCARCRLSARSRRVATPRTLRATWSGCLVAFTALVGANGRRAAADGREPASEIREVVELLALRLVRHDPRIGRHVGDRVRTRHELAVGEAIVQHAIEAVGLLDIALDGIGDFFGRIAREMMVLAGHRPEAADLPEQPLERFGMAAQVLGNELLGLFRQIHENRARLEHRDRLAAAGRGVIHDRRHPVVGRDGQEFGLVLLSCAEVHGDHPYRAAPPLPETS